jgi:hypothetical protein
MKWRLSAWKASTSRPSVDPNESLGIPFIVGWKEMLLGAVSGSVWTNESKNYPSDYHGWILRNSEDSVKLNTSFAERLNLTIRQGSASLGRRTICQARWKQRLEDHIELFRCYYNFIRPHRALKFGRAVRTPAWQAGLTDRALALREIFSSKMVFLALKNLLFKTLWAVSFRIPGVRLAAYQQLMTEAPLEDFEWESDAGLFRPSALLASTFFYDSSSQAPVPKPLSTRRRFCTASALITLG